MSKRSLSHDAPLASSSITSHAPKRSKEVHKQANSDEQDSFDEDIIHFDATSHKGRKHSVRKKVECYSDSYGGSDDEARKPSIGNNDTDIIDDDDGSAEANSQLAEDSSAAKVTPFNMREEEAEGSFDAEGTFIPARDEHAHLDRWLEHTSIYRPAASTMRRAAVDGAIKRLSEGDAWKELAGLIGIHTPLEAIRLRAPAPLSATARRKGLVRHTDPKARLEIDQITELCSLLMDDYGHTDIYDEHAFSNKDGIV